MNICIFHYHLNPGGVTRIIESQIKAIQNELPDSSIKILTGCCANNYFAQEHGVEIIVNDDFNYLNSPTAEYQTLYNSILITIQKHCTRKDILHFHNPNLGKNPLVTLAVATLAEKGYHIVNHSHDFPEDRPENIVFLRNIIEKNFNKKLWKVLFPSFYNYQIAVLNSFDLERVYKSGLAQERIHLLPNPVSFSPQLYNNKQKAISTDSIRKEIESKLGLDSNKKIIIYPVRVIERKNIAEFILLAVLFQEKANWIVTQPPKNQKELTPYNCWKNFCDKEGITIFWEAGNKVDFEKLLLISDYCISTSIKEGFGMVFLEPWVLGTQVIGRDIPSVTYDFRSSGIIFPQLYDSLIVADGKQMHQLSLDEQMKVIKICKSKDSFRTEIIANNIFLKDFLIEENLSLINKNKEVILKEYSLEKYGKRLHEIYRRIIESSRAH